MDFKSLIDKINSLDDAVETVKAPEQAEPIRLDEDTELRVLAGVTALTESVIAEKSVSKAQQKAMGAALAAKRGDIPMSKLKGASKEMAKMSEKDLEDFAKTKHKGLPEKVKKEDVAVDEAASGVRATDKKKGTVEKSTRKQYFVKLEKDGSTKGMTVVADEGETMSEVKARVARDSRSSGWTVASIREKTGVGESFYNKFDALVQEAKEADDKKKAEEDKRKKEEKKKKIAKIVDEGSKPDFLDIDKDGDKTEPMKKAAKEAGKGDKKDSKKGMTAKQEKYFGKKKTVKESVEPKMSFRDMMKLVVESGGQQQIDPLDKELFAWAERVANAKFTESMKAEVYAGLVYERMGGRFEMYDVLSENQDNQ